jgi:hypothetical protein
MSSFFHYTHACLSPSPPPLTSLSPLNPKENSIQMEMEMGISKYNEEEEGEREEEEEKENKIKKVKGKRPDRSSLLQHKSIVDNITIVRKLNSVCKDTIVRKHIGNYVEIINLVITFTYLFLNQYLLTLLKDQNGRDYIIHGGIPIGEKLVSKIISKITQTEPSKKNNSPWKGFDESMTALMTIVGEDEKRRMYKGCKGLARAMNEISNSIWTMCSNHIVTHLYHRITRWIKMKMKLKSFSQSRRLLEMSFSQTEKKRKLSLSSSSIVNSDEEKKSIEEIHQFLQYYPSKENINKHFNHFFCVHYKILKDMEDNNKEITEVRGKTIPD